MEIAYAHPFTYPFHLCFKIDGIVWKSFRIEINKGYKGCFKIDGIVWK